MDDKRTLIAFLLVGVIFLLMPYYYDLMGVAAPAPEPESVAEARRAGADSVESMGQQDRAAQLAAADHVVPGATAEASPEPPTAARPERTVEVITPRQLLRFSTSGGTLVSLQLRGYSRAKGGPVELVVPGSRCLALALESESAAADALDLSGVHFEPSAERLEIADGGQGVLSLTARLPDGRSVERLYRVSADRFGVEMGVRFQGFTDDAIAQVSWERGIALAERDASLDLGSMKAMAYLNGSLSTIQVDDDESDSLAERGEVSWVGVRNKYFMAAVAPLDEARHRVALAGRPRTDEPFRTYEYSIGTRLGDLTDNQWDLLLYAGPLDLEQVTPYERDFARAMDLGFPVVRDIAKLLLRLFVIAYGVIPNYGWIIVVFGLLVKIVVYPLTHKSYESAAKMQELQPKLMALREKYKSNNQRLSQETMKLYRDEGINPLGGCLPLILQMPVFIAMYQVFSSAIQLRQTPWILWIDDLSLPDTVVVAGFDFHVLPLLMSASMFFQSRMTMKDPKQAALVYVMPVVMVFVMWSFSSGLVLYWTVFNVLQIGQQYLTNWLKHRAHLASVAVRK